MDYLITNTYRLYQTYFSVEPDWIHDTQCFNERMWSGLHFDDSQKYISITDEQDYTFSIRGLDAVPQGKASRTEVFFAVRPFCDRVRKMWIQADGLIETVNSKYDSVTLQHSRANYWVQDDKGDTSDPSIQERLKVGWVDTRFDNVRHVNKNPLNNGATITKPRAYVEAVGNEWDKSMYEIHFNESTHEWEPPMPRFELDQGDRVTTDLTEIILEPRPCAYLFRIYFDTLDNLHQLGGNMYLNFHCEIEEP